LWWGLAQKDTSFMLGPLAKGHFIHARSSIWTWSSSMRDYFSTVVHISTSRSKF
jgi:hypothetical protein